MRLAFVLLAAILKESIRAVVSQCGDLMDGGTILDTFSSPNYPAKYPPNLDCVRVVQARAGYDIRVAFKDRFEIETPYVIGHSVVDCPNDWLEFRDGRYGFSPLIGKFCGSEAPQTPVIAKSGFLWIRFRSDDQLEYAGFSAKIEMVRNRMSPPLGLGECHLVFSHGLDGVLNSRQLSSFVAPNISSEVECVWLIRVPSSLSIVLYISEFKLKYPNQCNRNFVEVYAGQTTDLPIRRFCGLTASTVFTSQSEILVRMYLNSAKLLASTDLSALYSAYSRHKNCSSLGLFTCGDENCVPHGLVCNGRMNCPYGRDETSCREAGQVLKSIMRSGYTPLISLIAGVFIVVVGLFIWSCKSSAFCRSSDVRRSCTSYLPPNGFYANGRV